MSTELKDRETTLEDLETALDDIKDCWQRGDTLEIPAPLERARALISDLQAADDPLENYEEGHVESVLVTDMIDYGLIHSRIRQDATEEFSPLPGAIVVDPGEWVIDYWLIEDNCVHYRVTHPDSPVKSEVREFDV